MIPAALPSCAPQSQPSPAQPGYTAFRKSYLSSLQASRGGTELQVHTRVWFQGPPCLLITRHAGVLLAPQPHLRLGPSRKVLSKHRLQAPALRGHCSQSASPLLPQTSSEGNARSGLTSELCPKPCPGVNIRHLPLLICWYFTNSWQRDLVHGIIIFFLKTMRCSLQFCK